MTLSVKRLTNDMMYFHALLFDRTFMKTMKISARSEQSLAKPLRFYIAGLHAGTWPESRADELKKDGIVDGDAGHPKRIDYWVEGIAVEVASLSTSEAIKNPSKLRASSNQSEIVKLSECDCKSVLYLFDLRLYSDFPSFEFLKNYRSQAKKINNKISNRKYNFNVCYVYRLNGYSYSESIRIYQGRK